MALRPQPGDRQCRRRILLIERLPALLLTMPEEGLAALRDRALRLLGYAGAFRRSELVAFDVEDLKFTAAGLYVWIAAAKNDPRKAIRVRPPATGPKAELCAVVALERWLETIGSSGPLFRGFDLRGQVTEHRHDPGDVARILRSRAAAAGVAGDFAGQFAAARVHHERGEEEVPDREHQARDGAAIERGGAGLVAAATLDDARRFWRS